VRIVDDEAGCAITLRVTGYQFPHAEDRRQRCSWHVVAGEASCPNGAWEFTYPALTCSESPRVARWLRDVARWHEDTRAERGAGPEPAPLRFTEPNLSFTVRTDGAADIDLQIAFALEFRPPWDTSSGVSAPFVVGIRATVDQLRQAAADWDAEIAPYPDCG
jgi:hypothetical protein